MSALVPNSGGNMSADVSKKQQAIQLLRDINQIGWGNQGTITGVEESVDISKLWMLPDHPIDYSDDDIAAMRESMQSEGQRDPIHVVYALAPQQNTEDSLDNERPSLLVVDGHLRLRALYTMGKQGYNVKIKVKPYAGLMDIFMDYAVRSLSRREYSSQEIGRMILRIRLGYLHDVQEGRIVDAFPSYAELARKFGRSKSTVHAWAQLAEADETFVQYAYTQAFTDAQVAHLAELPSEQRFTAAKQIVSLGLPEPERVIVTPTTKASRSTPSLKLAEGTIELKDTQVPYDTLVSLQRIKRRTSIPLAIAALLFDVSTLIDIQVQDSKYTHSSVKKLRKLLNDPALSLFIRDQLGIADSDVIVDSEEIS